MKFKNLTKFLTKGQTEVVTNAEEDQRHRALLRILKETRGAWANDKEFDKRQKN